MTADEQDSEPLRRLSELNNELLATQRQLALKNQELEQANRQLREALQKIRTLKALLPICANCKKIRDDHGYWQEVEEYISAHTDTQFSHGLCQPCAQKLYPDLMQDVNGEKRPKDTTRTEIKENP